jgi:octaprenyl-diphosphate synthase
MSLTIDRAQRDDTMATLERVSAERGAPEAAARIADLRAWIAGDLAEVETELAGIERGDDPMRGAAMHLLRQGGKRLRPMCVALAARVGTGFDRRARDLAVAAELIHDATLLHDDVVDLGDLRRGAPAARVVYGNTASIFAGDWLLVEGITRIRRTGFDDLLDRSLVVLRQMLAGEALQLAMRAKVPQGTEAYFQVVEGKTASLFRWALFAGARAGGLGEAECALLEGYGAKLGVAFQVMDDVLDLVGDHSEMGKEAFSDLREGKLTHPLMVAIERDPRLRDLLIEALAAGDVADPALHRAVSAALRSTGAADESRALAQRLVREAVATLHALPPGRARDALADVAVSMVDRRK